MAFYTSLASTHKIPLVSLIKCSEIKGSPVTFWLSQGMPGLKASEKPRKKQCQMSTKLSFLLVSLLYQEVKNQKQPVVRVPHMYFVLSLNQVIVLTSELEKIKA